MKVLLILAACLFFYANGDLIETTTCGGVGTHRELRINGCGGARCDMIAGTPYPCESDVIPSSSYPELRLLVTTFYFSNLTILDTVLPNSSVQQGILYTIRFTVTPNDVLAGSTLRITAKIIDPITGREEICISFPVYISLA